MSGLQEEYAGRVISGNEDATTEEAIQVIESLGWHNHGLVIRSPDGEILWSQADHQVNMEDVREAIQEILASGGE